ncbi:3-hydroxyacyl-CoA dehydrogenase NAD-binding domain-containing protein [Croceicoccus sp. F390]|uniref:3-hydroxyacyl-CoA dehydrogenase NAD-binding domain-containing protein n=1 Tax=Croceicoccus esteveae TaxID=3075597 RepID=A0ABU2ZHW4_9SPHN|nr:3-hydroxyacyl-CoA dehydrogenase NAD-binding domain-containing protein [Croceicoccus sp. F390]MDT0575884.1 3-hydroxyacyl-CoA dehydrogenase NAD-binding domain-containing protein [Croceicoccus sp. F390]
MKRQVTYRRDGNIAEALIDNSAAGANVQQISGSLAEALRTFDKDMQAEALIIRCLGRSFVGDADVDAFGKAQPRVGEVFSAMDRIGKPIVAVVHGKVLGAGLELALSAHYRIADEGAVFGFPEVKQGRIPANGGTQRTPRLAGLDLAIRLVAQGEKIDAGAAKAAGLIDEIARGDLARAARDFANMLLDQDAGPRSAGDLPMPADDPALFSAARKFLGRRMRGHEAPLIALDALCLGYETDFADALDREHAMGKVAVAGPQARALRHVHAAERMVAHVPGLGADIAPRRIDTAGVVGLGTMGRGIVMAIAAAGIPVVAVAQNEAQVAAAQKAVGTMWSKSVARGSLTQHAMDEQMARVTWSADMATLDAAQLVIEAVTEDPDIKADVFQELGRMARSGTILASNTSFLDLAMLADASGRPAEVAGMHFFNPAHVMRLLENVRTQRTAPDVVATIMAFGRKIGKLPVLSGACDGFIVNRMLAKRSREGFFLIEEGATPQAIDEAMTEFGFPMGPLALGDLAGLDVQAAARKARRSTMTERELRADFPEQMVAAGRLGQKTGAGWYAYDDKRKASDDPYTRAMIVAHAARHAIPLRDIDRQEIVERLILAMVNEGARLLGEGIVPRPHEIDVAMINGIGFPAFTGGPMFWADQRGLQTVLATIERFAAEQGAQYWTPAPLLVERAAQDKGFYS